MVPGNSNPDDLLVSRLLSGHGIKLRKLAEETGTAAAPVDDVADDVKQWLSGSAGQYDVRGEIARGGIGVIMEGRDGEIGRRVAIKVLQDRHRNSPGIVKRFVEEAQIGGQLQHPGIVPVYQIGVRDGCPFFAMKLIQGRTLGALLEERESPKDDLPRLLSVFEAVCQTMAYAHTRGVIHRDLKPANVMVGQFGEVQVVDWGLAKVLDRSGDADPESSDLATAPVETLRSDSSDDGSKSRDGAVFGTPAYMAPEQARGEVELVDERSDVFGLGAILCAILTGEPPYRGSADQALLRAAMGGIEPALERLRECGVDEELLEIAVACLELEPQDRPASAAVVAERVSAYRAGVERRAQDALLKAAEAKVKARATLLVSAAVILAVLIGSGAWLYVRHEAEQRRLVANQHIDDLLQKANAVAVTARADGWRKLDGFDRAIELAEAVVSDANSRDVESSRRERAERELQALRDDREAAVAEAGVRARERQMVERIELARLPTDEAFQLDTWDDLEVRRLAKALAVTFEEFLGGRPLVDLDVVDAVAAMRGNIRSELATALDLWRLARIAARGSKDTADDASQKLRSVADALDEDDWRRQLRAIEPGAAGAAAVRNIAASTAMADLSVASVTLLAESLIAAGAADEGLAVYLKGHDFHRGDFGLTYRLAVLHANRGDWLRSAEYFRAASALRPDMIEPQHMLGTALSELEQNDEAARIFERILEQRPRSWHYQFHLARSYMEIGKIEQARAMLEDLNKRKPNSPSPKGLLALLVRTDGDRERMYELLRGALRLGGRGSELRGLLATELLRDRRFGEAIEQLQLVVKNQPQARKWLEMLGNACLQGGREDVYIEAVAAHEGRGPVSPTARYLLAQACLRLQRFDEAAVAFRAVRKSKRFGAEAGYELAMIERRRGRLARELEELRRVVAEYPAMLGARYSIIRVLLDTDQRAEAAAHARVLLRDPVGKGALLADVARLMQGERLWDLAGDLSERAIQLGVPDPRKSYLALGTARLSAGRLMEAQTALRAAVSLSPDNAMVRATLASCLEQDDRLSAAIEELSEGLARSPKQMRLLASRARMRAAAGDLQGARDDLAALRAVAPEQPKVQIDFEGLAGKIDDLRARQDLRRFVDSDELESGSVSILEAAALAARLGMPARALALYERIAAQQPQALMPPETQTAARAALRLSADPKVDEARRAQARRLALRWLRAELADTSASARERRSAWDFPGDFDAMRGEALGKLPEREQREWERFWSDVAAAR